MRHSTIPRTLHRPRRLGAGSHPSVLRHRLQHQRAARPFPSLHQPLDRRRRALMEGLAAGVLTVLLTGVAIAAPEVLQQSPLTTLHDLAGRLVPSLAPSAPSPLIDCP